MSRTVHHVRPRHRKHPVNSSPHPWSLDTGHILTALRYSEQASARARRERRRPVPTLVVRSFVAYTFPRSLNSDISGPYESRARAALQAFRTTARTRLRAAAPGDLLTAAEELDHPPTRHRHADLW
ncbi:hypothetical protein [Streptomyces griseus]|uniref:hypothetical protein n=1 Tax=Streptomyces griseus TaxID=1911 RepID=UPI00055FA3E1|nr:hypothetical protein [Streptomyces griseus]